MFNLSPSRAGMILLLSVFSLAAMSQQPIRQYKFISHKTGFVAGEASLSPSGKLLLATFNDLNNKAAYELIDILSMRLISSGPLDATPLKSCWSPDSKYMALEFAHRNSSIYSMGSGMKKMFTLSRSGATVFKPMTTLLDNKPKEPEIFVFGDDVTYRYNAFGQLLDSVEQDDSYSVYDGWYNQLQRNFTIINGDGFHTYTAQGKYSDSKEVTGFDIYKSYMVDQDGSTMLLYDRNGYAWYDAASGRTMQEMYDDDMSAACITPDKKNVLYKSPGKLTLVSEKKAKTQMAFPDFYSTLFYAGFGTELVCLNPDEVKIYACKNYMPVKSAVAPVKPAPVPVEIPVAKHEPPAEKTTPQQPKWDQPYTIEQFITPKQNDSFYLYNPERTIRYYINYKKGEGNILWPNPYFYQQFFGFAADQKYQSVYTYTLDNTNGESKLGTYAYSSAYEKKEQMVGGQNFLAKIPLAKGQTISWTNRLYNEAYTLSAQIVDMVYKGKMKKFLAVTRSGTMNGQPIDESFYYQQWYGLTFIKSGGKIVFERSF